MYINNLSDDIAGLVPWVLLGLFGVGSGTGGYLFYRGRLPRLRGSLQSHLITGGSGYLDGKLKASMGTAMGREIQLAQESGLAGLQARLHAERDETGAVRTHITNLEHGTAEMEVLERGQTQSLPVRSSRLSHRDTVLFVTGLGTQRVVLARLAFEDQSEE